MILVPKFKDVCTSEKDHSAIQLKKSYETTTLAKNENCFHYLHYSLGYRQKGKSCLIMWISAPIFGFGPKIQIYVLENEKIMTFEIQG